MVEAGLKFLDDPSEDVRRAFRDVHPKDHALFVAANGCDSNRLRPQFGSAGVFPSRVLKAQPLHEGSIHLLYGVNEINNRVTSC